MYSDKAANFNEICWLTGEDFNHNSDPLVPKKQTHQFSLCDVMHLISTHLYHFHLEAS